MGEEEIKSLLPANLGLFGKGVCAINKKRKLRLKTVDGVFLGYAIHSVGYKILIIESI